MGFEMEEMQMIKKNKQQQQLLHVLICNVCFMVMVKPSSGLYKCNKSHFLSFCSFYD